MPVVISQFKGQYSFLSNFHYADVEYEEMKFKSSEAAFQAAKTKDKELRKKFQTLSPSQAKKLGRRIPLREDWEDVKVAIMEEIVMNKFTQNIGLKEQLLETKDAILIEGNWWHDDFWGVDIESGFGLNRLGLILMKVRDNLQNRSE